MTSDLLGLVRAVGYVSLVFRLPYILHLSFKVVDVHVGVNNMQSGGSLTV